MHHKCVNVNAKHLCKSQHYFSGATNNTNVVNFVDISFKSKICVHFLAIMAGVIPQMMETRILIGQGIYPNTV